jgi:SMC interacting uncharacterized protein involved in chromosome segregation
MILEELLERLRTLDCYWDRLGKIRIYFHSHGEAFDQVIARGEFPLDRVSDEIPKPISQWKSVRKIRGEHEKVKRLQAQARADATQINNLIGQCRLHFQEAIELAEEHDEIIRRLQLELAESRERARQAEEILAAQSEAGRAEIDRLTAQLALMRGEITEQVGRANQTLTVIRARIPGGVQCPTIGHLE